MQRIVSLTTLSLGYCPYLKSVFLSDAIRFVYLSNCSQLETIKAYKKNFKLVSEGCFALKVN